MYYMTVPARFFDTRLQTKQFMDSFDEWFRGQEPPYEWTTDVDSSLWTPTVTYDVSINPMNFPIAWSFRIGDLLKNWRACLDIVVNDEIKSRTPAGTEPVKYYFPLADSESQFKKATKKLRPYVRDEFFEWMRRNQPYAQAEGRFFETSAEHEASHALRVLGNLDKHNETLRIVGRASEPEFPAGVPSDLTIDWVGDLIEETALVAHIEYPRPKIGSAARPIPTIPYVPCVVAGKDFVWPITPLLIFIDLTVEHVLRDLLDSGLVE